jgi:putative ABC transport system permease protein
MFQDVRYAVRVLSKKPAFTAIVAITLGLGIGANSAIFSVADAFLLKPVGFESIERLVAVQERAPKQSEWNSVAPANYLDWKSQNRSFERLIASEWINVNLTGEREPELAIAFRISLDFFETLGVRPMLGRGFLAEEAQPGKEQVVVLGYGLWERRYASDRAIVGKIVKMDGKPFTVAGVMPKGFNFPLPAQLWVPLALTLAETSQRSPHTLHVLGRLKPGVSEGQARAEMETIAQRMEVAYPLTNKGWGVWLQPLRIFINGNLTREYTELLLVAVGFVLLIACANVANLQFARAAGRQREMALRTALGASRWRVMRQLLTESVILALAGSVLGLLLGEWGIELIRGNMPADVARFVSGWQEIRLDGRTLAFTLAVAVVAGIISGLAPALQASRPNLNETLKEGGRGSTAGHARRRLRSILLVGEVALALILLVGAGLMVRGVGALLNVNQNFAPDSLLTLRFELPDGKYRELPARRAFYQETLRQFQAIPRVESASISTHVPYGNGGESGYVTIEGKPAPEAGEYRATHLLTISPNYFQAMHIRLRDGREFSERDGPDSLLVAIVSDRLARRYWPGENPLGRHIKTGPANVEGPWLTVVGVAEDVHEDWYERDPLPSLYRPYLQAPQNFGFISLRCAGDPLSFITASRGAIAGVDPDLPLSEIKTLERVMKDSIIGLTYVAVMMTVLGLVALVLACVGVYGVMAYAVEERTHEIGIRLALGAGRADVLRMVMGRSLLVTAVGLGIGLTVSVLLARFLSSLIFGVSAMDWMTFGGVSAALTASAMLASYVPALRAVRVDPVVALRNE